MYRVAVNTYYIERRYVSISVFVVKAGKASPSDDYTLSIFLPVLSSLTVSWGMHKGIDIFYHITYTADTLHVRIMVA